MSEEPVSQEPVSEEPVSQEPVSEEPGSEARPRGDEVAKARLAGAAAARDFPPEGLPRLLAYLRAVLEAGATVNLTGAKDLPEAVEVLAVTAFAVIPAWGRPRPPRAVVDVGSGNGFPGVVAALAWPNARVLLVERRAKKARAVAACLAASGIESAEALALDVRDLARARPSLRGAVDLVTARAVGTLAEVVPAASSLLAPGGVLAHWKGAALSEAERGEGARAAGRAGLLVRPDLTFDDDLGPARLLRYERPREA